MDMGSLMWEDATRDQEAERAELSRTAALTEAEQAVWPLLALAGDRGDLDHRLALAQDRIASIASRRGYDGQHLRADMVRRWELLDEARQADFKRQRTAAFQRDARTRAEAQLTARAALDNPGVPLAECQRLAAEAVTKEADAYPLAYESWGSVPDGPFTHRVKNWAPDEMAKKPNQPPEPGTRRIDGPHGQTGLFPQPDREAAPERPEEAMPPEPPKPPSHVNQTLF